MTYLRKYTKEQLIALARERGIYPPEDATDEELKGVERRLSAEREWICEPQPARHRVADWAAQHCGQDTTRTPRRRGRTPSGGTATAGDSGGF